VQVIDNLSKVAFTGAEMEAQAEMTTGLTAYASLGLLDSDIKDFDASERNRSRSRRQRGVEFFVAIVRCPLIGTHTPNT